MKINSINSFYIKNNNTKHLAEKKMKIEDTAKYNNEKINNCNVSIKKEGGGTKNSINNCYIL